MRMYAKVFSRLPLPTNLKLSFHLSVRDYVIPNFLLWSLRSYNIAGRLFLTRSLFGQWSHGGVGWRGENAIGKMESPFLNQLVS
jgi:hypothetical protein